MLYPLRIALEIVVVVVIVGLVFCVPIARGLGRLKRHFRMTKTEAKEAYRNELQEPKQ